MSTSIEQQGLIPETSRIDQSPKSLKKMRQQERRLIRLGATEASFPKINAVLEFLDTTEFSNTIPARDELYKRLIGLTMGTRVPLVVFNCLDFVWEEDLNNYPLSTILYDTSTAISCFSSKSIENTATALDMLAPQGESGIDLRIIVPDSELFDSRVFRYAQSYDERQQIAIGVKNSLKAQLSQESGINIGSVCLWSEYCKEYGLLPPDEYTRINAERLKAASLADEASPGEKNMYQGLRKQIGDSAQHLINNGLRSDYVRYEIPRLTQNDRTLWYCAMYMGEDQALAESEAIVLNLEDLRVSKWYNVGSRDKLPILTPVNPSNYYQWRNGLQYIKKGAL